MQPKSRRLVTEQALEDTMSGRLEEVENKLGIRVGGPQPATGWWVKIPEVSDTFNRPDTSEGGTLGVTSSGSKPWHDYHQVYLIRSQQMVQNIGRYSIADVAIVTADAEVTAEFDVAVTAGLRFGVTARHDGTELSYYSAYIHADEDTFYLFRSNPNGGTNVLWSEAIEITYGAYQLGLRTIEVNNETQLTVLLNGEEHGTYLDDRADRPQGHRFGIRMNRPHDSVAVNHFATQIF